MGLAAITAALPVTDAWPRDLIAGWAERENAGRSVNSRLRLLAASLRLFSTGVFLVTVVPSLAIVGRSCWSRPGSFWNVSRRLPS